MKSSMKLTRSIVFSLLLSGLAGCHYYEDFRLKKTQADIQEERAELMRTYRECLRKYEDDPPKAKEYCAAYSQSPQEIEIKRENVR